MRYLCLSLLVVMLVSCGKTTNYSTCNLNYTANKALDSTQIVHYVAVYAGNGGSISSISYLDSTGTITVTKPVIPFTQTVVLKKGTTITMALAGTANQGGSINMSVITDSATVISCNN